MKKMFYIILLIAVVVSTGLFAMDSAKAAALTSITDTMSRLKASQASNHTIQYTTPTGMSSGTITIGLGTAGFDEGSVAFGDVDLSYGANGTENEQTLAAAAGDAEWGAAVDGSGDLVLTYPTANGTPITAGWKVIVKIGTNATGGTNQYTNPASTGSKKVSIAAGSDSGDYAVVIITDDQVQVTATIDPSISFAISDNTVGFGNMNVSAARYATGDGQGSASAVAAFSVTDVATNAANGLVISTQSNNANSTAGLYSSTRSETIVADAVADIVAGTDGFAFCGTNATSLDVAAGFACETGATAITTAAQTFVSASAPLSAGSVDVRLKAAVGGTTKAATDYATTLTIIATGNF